MAVSLDSKVVFKERALLIGMDPVVFTALEVAGIDTLAKLAFCSSYQPGANDDSALIAVLTDATGGPVGVAAKAVFRRLHFEASTMNLAEMKSKIERTDDSAPKRLPAPQRAAVYEKQGKKLHGMDLVGELECSNALIDEVFQQREDETLRYLPPERCTQRESEITGEKKKDAVITIKQDNLKVQEAKHDVPADVSTELRIKSALIRRALAYDQCGLVEFATMNKWMEYLYQQLMRPAPNEKFSPVGMEQALAADKALFIVAARATRAGIAPRPDGTLPLQVALKEARTDPQVTMLLMPLPKAAGGGSGG